MIGDIYHWLTVLEEGSRNKHGNLIFRCQCICGKETTPLVSHVKRGLTKSCGCWARKEAKRVVQALCGKNKRHGMTGSLYYNVWNAMKTRCYNPKSKSWRRYGGRGIRVCDRWNGEMGFDNFFADMGARPSSRHTLERIDNDKDYCPENCRWATHSEQCRNKDINLMIEYKGDIRCLIDWADMFDLRPGTLRQRLVVYRWPVHEALTTPVNYRGKSLKNTRKTDDGIFIKQPNSRSISIGP